MTGTGQTGTVMNVPVIEEIIKQLMDREDGLLSSSMLQADTTRASWYTRHSDIWITRTRIIRSVTKMLHMRGLSYEVSLLAFQLEGCSRIPESQVRYTKKASSRTRDRKEKIQISFPGISWAG